MKIKKSELKSALSKVSPFVGGKGAVSYDTTFVRFAKTGNVIWITSNDLVNVANASLPVEDEGEGDISFTVLFKNLQSITFMKKEEISLKLVGEEKIVAKDGKSQITLALSPSDKLPAVDMAKEECKSISIDINQFRDSIRKVVFATDENSSRNFCRGICVVGGQDGLTLFATDSRRAAKSWKDGVYDQFKGVLTMKCLKAISLFDTGIVDFEFRENSVSISSENYRVFCALLSCDYPDVNSVMKGQDECVFFVTRQDVLDSLSLMSRAEEVGINFSFENGRLHVKVEEKDNVIEDWCDCDVIDGNGFEFKLNRAYFEDIFKNLNTEKVKLLYGGQYNVVRYDDCDGSYGALMPLR